jgi:glycine/D-amino acid oxidase-like deaminating enzyme
MIESTTENASWYETTQAASEPRPQLTYDIDVDVCVIGAGLAGLTAARELVRRGWSVAVIEGRQVAWAASGRNTGFVIPGFSEGIDDIVERIGLDHAKELWSLSERGVDYIRDTIAGTGMPGVDPVDGWLRVSKTDGGTGMRNYVERLRWIGAQVEAWPTERVRDVLRSDRYFAAAHFPRAFHIHPLNYASGLARDAEAKGVRIFEETPALTIDPDGVRKRVQTPLGRVRAPHVVVAGNVHLGELMPRLAATLIPITTYVIVTEPLGERLNEAVRYRGAVSDTERADNHYRIVGGDRLQWLGRLTTRPTDPQRVARGLVRSLRRVFPQLGDVTLAHAWSGTVGRAVHRMPQIGEIQPGLWVASGFSGHGLNTTAMAGELIARGIVDADQTWRLFAPYELVWAGGRIGRLVAQGLYAGSRPASAAAEAFARYRERRRRRNAARQVAGEAGAITDGTSPAVERRKGSRRRHAEKTADPSDSGAISN